MPAYVDAHGVSIVYDVSEAVGPARAVVQLLHGYGDHAGRYDRLIEALTAAGYVVYADDHRGHGRTGMGQWADAAKLGRLGPGGHLATVAALRQFTALIRAERPDLPLVMLGFSWGSLLAQILLEQDRHGYDGIVLVASGLRTFSGLNSGDFNKRWRSPDASGMEWLSRDDEVAAAFIADPLTFWGWFPGRYGYVDTLRMYGRPVSGARRDVPTLLMVGRDDPVGGPKSVHRLAEAYRTRSGFTDVTTLVYPGARHEIFQETNQAEVRADLLAWLDHRFPGREPGR